MKPIHLRNIPPPFETFNHVEFFNFIFSWLKPERYLELGVRDGKNFKQVSKYCKEAIAVDIQNPIFSLDQNMSYHTMLTDEYFAQLNKDVLFDAIFIDADHSYQQSLKDFLNVKDRIIEDGFVFFHDTYPYDYSMTVSTLSSDCYKTILYIKQNFIDEFEILTLPFNPGVTIVKKMKRNKQLIYEG